MKNTPKQLARWVNIIPFELTPSRIERISKKPSMTVPDLNTDLEEILSRFTRGEMITGLGAENGGSENASFDDLDIEEFNRLDLSEKQFIIEETNELIRQNTAKITGAKKAEKALEKGQNEPKEEGKEK